jgi:outer membrane protein assembly factor BamB
MLRLHRETRKMIWDCYGKEDDLVQMFSKPSLADGRLYFGEGFHDDPRCRVFCIDVESGDEIWSVRTEGQTESSPTVVNGKVYIGAGNDGFYCLDARNGAKLWRFPQEVAGAAAYQKRLQRFGGGSSVVGNRVYVGTGVDRNQKDDKGETATFCLDAGSGASLWKTAAPFPVWSTPLVKDGLVYVTTGNGDVLEDAKAPDQPGGALQCLDAATGKEQWRITLPNGVIGSPSIDSHRIYFGCRDGNVYCVNRADGKERWKSPLGSAVVASPVLDCDPAYERSLSVFAASSAGKICCLNPQNGAVVWTYDLSKTIDSTGKEIEQKAAIITTPYLVVTRTADGFVRQLYFGCGLGGGISSPTAFIENRPVFYCLEDTVKMD